MKIRIGKLRSLVREVAMSPSLFSNNAAVAGPLQKKPVADMIELLVQKFEETLRKNLILNSERYFDKETREFSDIAYKRLSKIAQIVADECKKQVIADMENSWQDAHSDIVVPLKRAA